MKSVFESPFYILGASPRDDRRRIMELADERALLSDAETVTRARVALMDPRERLAAELRWFPGTSDDDVTKILDWLREIEGGDVGHGPGASALGRVASLNVALWAFASRPLDGTESSILHVSRSFERLDDAVVRREIDADREASGFPQVAPGAELDDALRDLRKDIVKVLTDRLSKLDQEGYVVFVTQLADRYAQRGGPYEGHALLGDVIEQYALDVAGELETLKSHVAKTIAYVRRNVRSNVDAGARLLLSLVSRWDALSQPPRRAARASGMGSPLRGEAAEIFYDIRSLCIDLANDHQQFDAAFHVLSALRKSSTDLPPPIPDVLAKDVETLKGILQRKKDVEDQRQATIKMKGIFAIVALVFLLLYGTCGSGGSSKSGTSVTTPASPQAAQLKRQRAADLRGQLASLKRQVEEIDREREAMAPRLDELGTTLETMDAQLDSMKTKLETLKAHLETSSKTIARYKAEYAKAKKVQKKTWLTRHDDEVRRHNALVEEHDAIVERANALLRRGTTIQAEYDTLWQKDEALLEKRNGLADEHNAVLAELKRATASQ